MRIGFLTSGGDCPGLNAVIRAIVRKGDMVGYETIGILNGWKGIMEEQYLDLGVNDVAGIINRGGTILGTSRYSPFMEGEQGIRKLLGNISRAGFDALICIGGDGSMHIAQMAFEAGVNVIGVPKTIDNDIYGTDYTFGFDTASNVATDAIDRLHTTAESHHRVMLVEVMGRHSGWIAVRAGIAGGAEMVVIPEIKTTIEEILEVIRNRKKRGKLFSIIVVAEGCEYLWDEIQRKPREEDKKRDEFGRNRLGGISTYLAEEIERRSGIETRAVILSYIQRGGMPSAFDRLIGTRFGVYSVDMVTERKFGRMVALKGTRITDIPIQVAISKQKVVDPQYYDVAKVFFR